MYAIIETGSKQYKVQEGDIIDVELLGNTEGKVLFDKVLFLEDGSALQVGTPHVANCKVEGELLGIVKGPKLVTYKYRRRKNSRRKKGHRQKYTKVKITAIQKV
ncbi:MAG: 50S ribosomal protein L21 [Chlamydiota bacterium]